MQKHNYRFYPSLLDAYTWYASSENENAEQDFLNKINRVPFSSKEADKGTIFNEFIDNSLDMWEKFGLSYVDGIAVEIIEKLQGSQKQLFTSTTIEFDGISVELYGYLDYLKLEKVVDLKTTKAYELGKYKNSLQLHFYPVSLIDNGCEIEQFEFLVTDFEDVYSETYPVDYNTSKNILISKCKELIKFIESKRDLITDRKIFGLENDVVTIYEENYKVVEEVPGLFEQMGSEMNPVAELDNLISTTFLKS